MTTAADQLVYQASQEIHDHVRRQMETLLSPTNRPLLERFAGVVELMRASLPIEYEISCDEDTLALSIQADASEAVVRTCSALAPFTLTQRHLFSISESVALAYVDYGMQPPCAFEVTCHVTPIPLALTQPPSLPRAA